MKTKTHFAFRVDIWDADANSIVEHVAGVDDFEVAEAAYRAAVVRWPAARITLRQGARVVYESGRECKARRACGVARRVLYARTRRTPTTYLPRADPMLAR
jgi:hypothetical protein